MTYVYNDRPVSSLAANTSLREILVDNSNLLQNKKRRNVLFQASKILLIA